MYNHHHPIILTGEAEDALGYLVLTHMMEDLVAECTV